MESRFLASDHLFVVCAYKESIYLEDCIKSLLNQETDSKVIVTTATPNKHISSIAEKYGLELYTNSEPPSIAGDWNFAISQSDRPLVTLAHQDDIYKSAYTSALLKAINSVDRPLLFFTNYVELRGERIVAENALLRVKRILLSPLKAKIMWSSRFVRRRMLSLGSAICCPSVTMILPNLECPIFENGLKSNLDWQAWERISRKKGQFVYAAEPLIEHRIHEESETTALINDDTRSNEDLLMFEKFWPRPLARFINAQYERSRKSNKQ